MVSTRAMERVMINGTNVVWVLVSRDGSEYGETSSFLVVRFLSKDGRALRNSKTPSHAVHGIFWKRGVVLGTFISSKQWGQRIL